MISNFFYNILLPVVARYVAFLNMQYKLDTCLKTQYIEYAILTSHSTNTHQMSLKKNGFSAHLVVVGLLMASCAWLTTGDV